MNHSGDICVTADIIQSAIQPLDQVPFAEGLKIWKAICEALYQHVCKGRAVRLDRFGSFSIDSTRNLLCANHPEFLSRLSMPPSKQWGLDLKRIPKLSLSAVAVDLQVSRDAAQDLVDSIMNSVVSLVKEGRQVRLGFLPLGEWICSKCTVIFQSQLKRSVKKASISKNRSLKLSSSRNPEIVSTSRPLTSAALRELSRSQKNTNMKITTAGSRRTNVTMKENDCIPHNNQEELASRALDSKRVFDRIKASLLKRGGSHGIHGISRMMRIMDNSGDKKLSRDEFRFGLRDFGVDVTEAELDSLIQAFDCDQDGFISFDEFLVALRGDINPARLSMIEMAFQKLDRTHDGQVTIDDLRNVYDVSKHPEFIQGIKSKDVILAEFLSQWDIKDHDGIITMDEFVEYYRNVSASIDDDNYFELMIRNAWHLSGGKGQCANSTIKRVLVTHPDGHQTVEEVPESSELAPQHTKESDPLAYCKQLLFDPPCSLDMLAQKLGANRVLGNGQERIHAKVFVKTLFQLDKTLDFQQAQHIAKIFDPKGIQIIDVQFIHQTLSDRFGKMQQVSGNVVEKLKAKLVARGGVLGLHSVRRLMRICDEDGDGKLSKVELKKALEQYGVSINLQEVDHLMTLFDTDRNGTICFDELFVGLRGSMNDKRQILVKEAFKKLDVHGQGHITIDDLRRQYDTSRNPEVMAGKISERQALINFMAQWDTATKDGIVTFDEFEAYYQNLSALIDGDDYFELMIRNAWQLSPAPKQKAFLVKV
ncbi:hypothetical protein LEN26_007000 [Aphanomyces euteiches]|nr:hypothetical protein LEN26_007000 [Aphanomyces euteiches]KAH9190323.1 hypothetical protein AeNC1_007710 [Aphanomyces euteiches]